MKPKHLRKLAHRKSPSSIDVKSYTDGDTGLSVMETTAHYRNKKRKKRSSIQIHNGVATGDARALRRILQ